MDLMRAQHVMLRTHHAALKQGVRANALELISGPGIGKSSVVRGYCAELAQRLGEPVGLVTFMLATVSSVDIRGFMLPTKNPDAPTGMDSVFSTPPWMPTRMNTRVFLPDGTSKLAGEKLAGDTPTVGVLFLDEFGQAEDDTKKPAAELLLHGEVGTARLPLGWRVIAASNRLTDRSGVVRPLMFVTNRRCELHVEASYPAWLAWAEAQPLGTRPHYMTISFAAKHPGVVFKDSVPDKPGPFCTPRTLCLMDADLRALRSDEDAAADRMPLDADARELARGWIGEGEAAQYFAHLKFGEEIPDWSEILADPTTARLPEQRDAQMVCAYFVAHHVEAESADAAMVYLGRLKREMQVLAVRSATSNPDRARALIQAKAWSGWLQANKALLVAARA